MEATCAGRHRGPEQGLQSHDPSARTAKLDESSPDYRQSRFTAPWTHVHFLFNDHPRAYCPCRNAGGRQRRGANGRCIRHGAAETAFDAWSRESPSARSAIRLRPLFPPSDAAAAADWQQIAIHSVQSVEAAPNPRELASSLTTALGSVTVGVAVFPTGTEALPVRLTPSRYLIEWRHHGVGELSDNGIYYSERVTRPASGNADEIEVLRADLPGGVVVLFPGLFIPKRPARSG